MDNQPVFNGKEVAVTYVRSSFSKFEDQCQQVLEEATKKAFKDKLHHQLSTHKCSIQPVYMKNCFFQLIKTKQTFR